MDSGALRTIILWVHAAGGVAWIGACAAFVIVAIVSGDSDDDRARIARVAPAIGRVGVVAMVFIAISGVVNIYIAGMMRRFVFSSPFVAVLLAKIAIFFAMFAMLAASYRAIAQLSSSNMQSAQRASSRLMALNASIMASGMVALMLGLWLLGS